MTGSDTARGRDTVFRLLTEDDLAVARDTGVIPKRAIDEKDGYFHLSSETQLIETANLHFDGHDMLFAAKFMAAAMGDALVWELAPKRGEDFPHFYRDRLDWAAAEQLLTLKRRPGGSFAVTDTEYL